MTRCCSICGRPESAVNHIDNAHIDPKKMGGRGAKAPENAHDTLELCAGTGGNTDSGTCHGANEAGVLDLGRSADGHGTFRIRADLEDLGSQRIAADFIKRLAKRPPHGPGLKVSAGCEYVCRFEGMEAEDLAADCEVDIDEETACDIEAFIDLDRKAADTYNQQAMRLKAIRDRLVARHGPQVGMRAFREIAAEHMGIGKVPRSLMLSVADNLGAALADKPACIQQEAAYCIKHELGDPEDIVADFGSMPLLDARKKYGRISDTPAERAPRVTCPLGMTCSHPRED